ncbi:RNA-binding protein 39 isoform X1 [Patella vulgata]|uniref:RNA-binding protein 39 isoform X1 n=2 Tax=Patella vulgata TaxID=6465 RepID=UPI00218024C4|nr:RNA-binding protein 39 isoform X1 [Patella vulgata]
MSDDFDVEAMLEAPYRKEEEERGNEDPEYERSTSKTKKKKRTRSRSRSKGRGDRDRDRKSHRDRDRRRSRSRERKKSRSPKRDSRRSDRDKYRPRSRSPERTERRGGSGKYYDSYSYRKREERQMSKSPLRVSTVLPSIDLSPEEKDARTVFCMQLSARIRPRDLEEFFSSIGKVRDVRLITDNKTRRSKGIAYIEFMSTESVPLAIGLAGQKLLGVPIIVQASQAEKNRTAIPTSIMTKGIQGPMRLYVGSLHFNITEDMLKGIFQPFGKIEDIKLIRDHETGRSQGYGFVTFPEAEDAKKALEQLNGFELAGRPMKVGHVTERMAEMQAGGSMLDCEEMDRAGIDLGATGRLQLMAKLAEGTGFQIPQYAANALNQVGAPAPAAMLPTTLTTPPPPAVQQAPPIATQCFMLSNMFDPITESRMNWDQEIRDDVIEECSKHGGVLHIFVDKASPQGNVYVKNPTIAAAVASVSALHGRYFAGRIITAAYVPLPNYHALFPESVRANQLIVPSSQALQASYASGFSSMSQPVL